MKSLLCIINLSFILASCGGNDPSKAEQVENNDPPSSPVENNLDCLEKNFDSKELISKKMWEVSEKFWKLSQECKASRVEIKRFSEKMREQYGDF